MNDYKDYLKSLDLNEKEYTASFFKKKEYIENLNKTAIDNCNGNIVSSVGNCNSKIAIVINDYNNLNIVIRFMKPMLESINTSLWNIYTTCVIKSDSGDSNLWNQMIQYEMNAVSPLFSFMFVNDKQSFTEENYVVFNKTFPVVYINLDDVNYVLNKDNFKTERYTYIMNEFYKYVLKIIEYREIEISE